MLQIRTRATRSIGWTRFARGAGRWHRRAATRCGWLVLAVEPDDLLRLAADVVLAAGSEGER